MNETESAYIKMTESDGSFSKLIFVGDATYLIKVYDVAKRENIYEVELKHCICAFKVTVLNNLVFFAGGVLFGEEITGNQAESTINTFNPETFEINYNCGHLPKLLMDFEMCTVNNSIFVFGGKSHWEGKPTADVYRSEFTDGKFKWEYLCPMDVARYDFSFAVYENFIYVFGGLNRNDEALSESAKYDTLSNKWTKIKPLPLPRAGTGAAVLNGEIYVGGGFIDPMNETNDVFIYSPVTNSWRRGPSFILQKATFALLNVNNILYAFGGYCGEDASRFCEFLEGDKWIECDSPIYSFNDGAVGII